ncbi:MAG TPA: Holliday junction DNA helicase RuvA [Planctomycetes bacterium]|nr:Holliday junction DNA helicase RuvA [Planctomycetaceae bacterium]HIN54757.1 Holliday junction DNA helicase RuvA [Planctomycetota bacterium]
MIKYVTGRLVEVFDSSIIMENGPFHFEVLVPDFVRHNVQSLVGEDLSLHTILYFEGNPQGRMNPRMVGFLSKVELEFFELFCSVDGVGVKKALRSMVRPVREVALMIENQDVKGLSTLPGVGPATAERIIAKLRRKMAKFALLVSRDQAAVMDVEPDLVDQTCEVLRSLGHSDVEARRLIDAAVESGEKFKDVETLLNAVYQQTR